MITLTRKQREAIHKLYIREVTSAEIDSHRTARTYREIRRSVVPSFDCIMVPWCGMWLGIESDGYTHS